MNAGKSFLFVILFLSSSNAFAQSVDKDKKEEELIAVAEVGGAASRSIQEGSSSFGPTLAVEIEPIEGWLEIEAGVTPLFSHSSTEWNTDLILKKPWALSRKTEFMIGLGPEWVHSKGTNSLSGEFALDFMYWTSPRHRFGGYIEPTYDYSFRGGHERSLGVMGGLLIGVHR